MSADFNSSKQYWNNGTCGSLNTGLNAPRVITCDTNLSSDVVCLMRDSIVAENKLLELYHYLLRLKLKPSPEFLLLIMGESTEVEVGEGAC